MKLMLVHSHRSDQVRSDQLTTLFGSCFDFSRQKKFSSFFSKLEREKKKKKKKREREQERERAERDKRDVRRWNRDALVFLSVLHLTRREASLSCFLAPSSCAFERKKKTKKLQILNWKNQRSRREREEREEKRRQTDKEEWRLCTEEVSADEANAQLPGALLYLFFPFFCLLSFFRHPKC